MKNLTKRTIIATAVAAGVASLAQAPIALADGVALTPGVGYYSFDNDLNLDDTAAPSIGLQYMFGKNFAVEANYTESDVDADNPVNNLDWKHTRVDAFYNFTGISDAMVPYLVAGAGEAVNELSNGLETDETLVNAGAGVRFLLDKGFSVVADLRAVNSIDEEKTSGLASLGLTYAMDFGSSKSSQGDFEISSNEIKDSDSDGIADTQDACNDTPAGVAIGTDGCGLDGDADGIADYKDECAQTPNGVDVDSLGCPTDLDNDGIADYQDECPESVAGALIDSTGCDVQFSENIPFNLNSSELPSKALGQVEEIATFLKRYEQTIAVIEGHSDTSGDSAYNEQLSKLRAAQVKQVLVSEFGINPERIRTEGYGESRPIASNDTLEGRKQNRRVTATITTK